MNYRGRGSGWWKLMDPFPKTNSTEWKPSEKINTSVRCEWEKKFLVNSSRCFFIPSSEISIKMSINCSRNKFWIFSGDFCSETLKINGISFSVGSPLSTVADTRLLSSINYWNYKQMHEVQRQTRVQHGFITFKVGYVTALKKDECMHFSWSLWRIFQ